MVLVRGRSKVMSLLFRSKYCWNLHGDLSMVVTMYKHGGCQLESTQDESIKPCKSIKTSHCAVFSYCLLRGMRSAKGSKMHIVGFVNNMQRTRAIGTIMGSTKRCRVKNQKKNLSKITFLSPVGSNEQFSSVSWCI